MSGHDLFGRRVLVTGAAGGIGRASVLRLTEVGARVIAADINLTGAEETAALARAAGGHVRALRVDVTDAASCDAMADAVTADFGGLDVLVNNAAALAGISRRPFWELEDRDWDMTYAVNVKGVWRVTKALLPALRKSDAGAIVNMASVTAFSGSPNWMHYVATKGAVVSITRTMAKELGPDRIRVNAIAPGLVPTEAASGLIENAETYGIDKLALGRQATPDDIVGAMMFLASAMMSGFVTGQSLIVDGGRQFN